MPHLQVWGAPCSATRVTWHLRITYEPQHVRNGILDQATHEQGHRVLPRRSLPCSSFQRQTQDRTNIELTSRAGHFGTRVVMGLGSDDRDTFDSAARGACSKRNKRRPPVPKLTLFSIVHFTRSHSRQLRSCPGGHRTPSQGVTVGAGLIPFTFCTENATAHQDRGRQRPMVDILSGETTRHQR